MPVIIGVIVFAIVGMTAYSLLTFVFSDERLVARRLGGLTSYEAGEAAVAHPALRPFGERIVTPSRERFARTVAAVTPKNYAERVKKRIVLAGSPRGMSVGRFVNIKVLAALAIAALVAAAAGVSLAGPITWLLGFASVTLAFFAPDLWLSSTTASRQGKIRRELPDFLDMLTISVEAGLGFDAAIAKLVRTARGPLVQEFARMLQQVQVGVDRAAALRGMSERTEVAELDSFIASIIQAETFGISIAGVLRTQAKEMRLKRRQFAEERAQKVPVKIVFPIVLCILPATMIVVLGPAIVSIGRAFGML